MVIKGDFKGKHILAYTQTFQNERGFHKLKPMGQYRRTYGLLDELSKSCDYELTIEMTLNGVIHFHGILSIKDVKRYYDKTIKIMEAYGHKKLKEIDNMPKWLEYCNKDNDIYDKLFKGIPHPITQDNYHIAWMIKAKRREIKELSELLTKPLPQEEYPEDYYIESE